MTPTRVFIMAQGIQSRMHKLQTRKQLLEVGGMPLLGRICKQVFESGVLVRPETIGCSDTPTIIGWPDMAEVATKYGATLRTMRYPGVCILDGMHATSPWWSDYRNIFLLGDVVYSNDAMDTILSYEGDVQFFGTPDVGRATGELFGFVMNGREIVNQTAELLLIAPCRGVNATKGQGGHLRILLWLWMQCRGLHGDGIIEYHSDLLTPITDWTNDIDTDKQVAELLPLLDEKVREGL